MTLSFGYYDLGPSPSPSSWKQAGLLPIGLFLRNLSSKSEKIYIVLSENGFPHGQQMGMKWYIFSARPEQLNMRGESNGTGGESYNYYRTLTLTTVLYQWLIILRITPYHDTRPSHDWRDRDLRQWQKAGDQKSRRSSQLSAVLLHHPFGKDLESATLGSGLGRDFEQVQEDPGQTPGRSCTDIRLSSRWSDEHRRLHPLEEWKKICT